MFVVFLNVRDDHISPDLESICRTFKVRHDESVNPLLTLLHPRSQQIFFHEVYHFWQGLKLPFLFRYAFHSLFNVGRVFRQLATNNRDYHTWSCVVPEFHRLDRKSLFAFAPGGELFFAALGTPLPAELANQFQFSTLDLLECAATLAEFQVTTRTVADRSNPQVFRRWAKRNPAYLQPFEFASRFLGSESLTLRALLPLINATFYTSIPERTFVELLARAWGRLTCESDFSRQFLTQPEPCKWPELFQIWLDEINYDSPADGSYDESMSCDYHRLNWQFWIGTNYRARGITMTHPILGPLARRWAEDEKSNPVMSWLLDMPGWMNGDTAAHCHKQYAPPVTVARFHFADNSGRMFWFGTGDFSGCTEFEHWNNKGFIADFMTMYSAVRRASGGFFDGEQRVCYHSRCPHYSANFCNAYPIVPDDFNSCGFDRRMKRLIAVARGESNDSDDS